RKGDAPPYLGTPQTSVRKVEIHDVYDLKRWWWKATDGIRETTWPGVYNRSRLPGRNDYFQLPDWDCYSLSGKSVKFAMPDELWNHLEISGAAWGNMYVDTRGIELLFRRPQGQEKTFHRLTEARHGQQLRFENVEQEEPIGELSAYYVATEAEPQGSARLSYTLGTSSDSDKSVEPVSKFIAGRYAADERATLVAVADGAKPKSVVRNPKSDPSLPLVHIIIPAEAWENISDGLNGLAIDLPPLRVKPTHGEYFPLNIQVKDPLWLQRNLLDFSYSVRPNEARTLWLDTRDRILPPGKALYLTIAGAGSDFGPDSLAGARLRLIFKPRAEAVKEHELDRFTQARDSYAMLIEEHTNNPKLNLYNRFAADVTDLLRVNPNHWLGQTYWYDSNRSHPRPKFVQTAAPAGVPLWAFRQVEQLRNLKRVVLWYIDQRQIANGEFGGGLSDDGDLTNYWPATALMGSEPEKIKASLMKELDAFYSQGMFTNGLPTIQADELHSYEEGIQVLGQSLLLDYGDPKQLERAMETSRSLIQLTGVNRAGHRHIRSSYYSGTKLAEDEPWGWSKPSSILAFHPAMMLVEYNGNPQMKQIITELADGFLAHRKKNANANPRQSIAIRFADDQEAPNNRGNVLPVYWAAWKWTGDAKYLEPFKDQGARALESIPANALDQLALRQTWGNDIVAFVKGGPNGQRQNLAYRIPPNANSQRLNAPPPPNYALLHFAWQMTGDKHLLEQLYASQIEASAIREFMNTEGSMWIDRIDVPYAEIQRARLGGIALTRNSLYPGQAVSWTFQAPANEESTAILVPDATQQSLKIIAYNLSTSPVKTNMTAWDIEPGEWELVQGSDTDGDDVIDGVATTTTVALERTGTIELTFPPGVTTVLNLKLVTKGTPYWARPDLGISKDDVVVRERNVSVTVHSLGAIGTQVTTVALIDQGGTVRASTVLPRLEPPNDLMPRTTTVTFAVPFGVRLEGCSIVLDPDTKMNEITRVNNRVTL
ncbi:MAG TPA: hypothetical protein VGO68_18490, partial [Pyrinomonadaceae bacterium]|nr:hypothetical protein [Pyrinomonadaceae bacterium]